MQRPFTKLTLVFTLLFLGALAQAETVSSATPVSGSQPVQVAVTVTVQAPPLSVVSSSETQISLKWRDAFKDETAYQIERRRNSDGKIEFINLPKNSVSFTDDRVDTGETYEYRLRAWKLIIPTKPSASVIASAFAPLPQPMPAPLPSGSPYSSPYPAPPSTSTTSGYYGSTSLYYQ